MQNLTNFPYPAGWLDRLAYCFWVLDMVLFLFFSTMSVVRLIMFPKLSKVFYKDFIQTSYLGAIPITLDTIAIGQIVGGRVVRHTRRGTLVKITSNIGGIVHPTDTSDAEWSMLKPHSPTSEAFIYVAMTRLRSGV